MSKDYQYLSKRRKNQLINCEINCFTNFPSELAVPNRILNRIEKAVLTIKKSKNTLDSNLPLPENLNNCHELSLTSQFDVNSNDEHSFESQNNISPETNFDINLENNLKSFCNDLQTFIIEHNVPHNTANKLLQILRKHGHIELPNDVRVLLRTPRNASLHIKSVAGGHYVHFGLLFSLEQSIKMYSKFIKRNEISLNINIDGLPISNSSGSQFWPIMASIEKNKCLYIAFYNWYISWYIET